MAAGRVGLDGRLKMAVLLFLALCAVAAAQGKDTVAVYMDGAEPKSIPGSFKIFSGELGKAISRSTQYIAVNRSNNILDNLAKELNYALSGAVKDGGAERKKIGKQLGVQYLCVVEVSPVGTTGREFYVTAKLVNVTSAVEVNSATAKGELKEPDNMMALARAIALELTGVDVWAGSGGGGSNTTGTTFTDSRDGKTYKTVTIGGKRWFAQNLNYATSGSKCYENNTGNCDKYGRLYTWDDAMKACPAGWHVAKDEEWEALVKTAGGEKVAGTKLKSSTGWNSKSGVPAGTDNYGFSALPDGYGVSVGSFDAAGYGGNWWSATEDYADGAWHRSMYYDFQNVGRHDGGKTVLFSVRCMADKEAQK